MPATTTPTLEWPDYVILATILAISFAIGVYHSLTGGRQRTTAEFISANRRLSVLPAAISTFSSFHSAVSILGSTAEMYLYGAMYFVWMPVSHLLAALVVQQLFVPWIYPLKLVSINDYLERRYASRAVRAFGAAVQAINGIIYMGVAMYAPSVAMQSATGLSMVVSIPLMALVSIAYTSLGGLRAVIWTNVFQFVIQIGGLLAIMIKGIIVVGGASKVLEISSREGRLDITNWSLDPTERHTAWGFIVGMTVLWINIYGLAQPTIQRYSATESLSRARIMVLVNTPAKCLAHVIACTIGLTAFAFYALSRCDPLDNNDISSPNQLLPYFVMKIFSSSRGFSGLFLATLYGGTLSAVSSTLSGAAACFWDDVLKVPLASIAEHRKAAVNRVLVVVFGAVATGFAFLAAVMPGPVTQVSVLLWSAISGPMFGLFLMGGLSKHANSKGALVGGLASLAVSFWFTVGSSTLRSIHAPLPSVSLDGCSADNTTSFTLNQTDNVSVTLNSLLRTSSGFPDVVTASTQLTGLARFYCVSYVWNTIFGAINAIIIGLVTSFIFRDRNAEEAVDECLLIPFRRYLFCSRTREQSSEKQAGQYTTVDKSANAEQQLGEKIELKVADETEAVVL